MHWVNGEYKNATIIVNADSDSRTQERIASHEYYHAIATPELTQATINTLQQSLGIEQYQKVINDYAEAYYGVYGNDSAKVIQEIAADLYSFNTNARQAVDDVVDRGVNNDGVRYAINPNFANEIDNWDEKTRKIFKLGTTSQALQSIGIDSRKITIKSDKINDIFRDHKGMNKSVIKQIPNVLENPIIVLKSTSKNTSKADSRIVVYGELFDNTEKPILTAIELEPTSKRGRYQNFNLVVSTYEVSNNYAKNQIETSPILYLDSNKNRTYNWRQSVGLQLPSDTNNLGSIGRVTYTDGKVKIKGKTFNEIFNADATTAPEVRYSLNNTGEILTKAQQLTELEAYHKRRLEAIAKQPLNSQDLAKQMKAEGMKYSAAKREIIQGDSLNIVKGGLTETELRKKIDKLNTNYKGKTVTTASGETGTVQNVAFGKVSLLMPDGSVKRYDQDKIVSPKIPYPGAKVPQALPDNVSVIENEILSPENIQFELDNGLAMVQGNLDLNKGIADIHFFKKAKNYLSNTDIKAITEYIATYLQNKNIKTVLNSRSDFILKKVQNNLINSGLFLDGNVGKEDYYNNDFNGVGDDFHKR